MKLCTMTGEHQLRLGERSGIKALSDAGFDSLDLSLHKYPPDGILSKPDGEIVAHFTDLREYIESCGLCVNQTHPRYPTETDPDSRELLRRELVASMALGARFAVVHPVKLPGEPRGKIKAVNVGFYSSLVPIIADSGLKIGIENMFMTDHALGRLVPSVCSTAEELADYVDTMNEIAPGRFAACLDIGHANLVAGEPLGDVIRKLGTRIELLHVHDNDGLRDRHSAPGFGCIAWDEVASALGEVGYSGDFSFESYGFFRSFGDEMLPDASRMLVKIGRRLVGRIDGDL